MAIELNKNYSHFEVEENKSNYWEKKKYHKADVNNKLNKKTFSMIVPPPNVTGILHIGHAKNTVEMDVVARYKRLQGYDVLFLPATDHAGIATQARVEQALKQEGISRYDLGREKFLERTFQWKDEYAGYFHKQWSVLGISMDYSLERFTLDKGMCEAVNKVFKTLYDQKLIYQGERIINWDPQLKTALSNIEVEYKEVDGHFYFFKYRSVKDPSFYLEIATTRPETMFGDTALVCNPSDERYTKYKGELFINPSNGEAIPLITDYYVEKEFGTGVMKCTPAHDPNDFNIGKRHNLEMPIVMNLDGTMNDKCPKEYVGLDRFEARKLLVENLKKSDDLIKIEDIKHSVGHSERSNVIVEPMLSKQWYVKMKPLVEDVLKFQKGKDKTKFLPTRFEKIFKQWLNKTEDWCISRQLWWGHRIPVYYDKETGEAICSIKTPDLDKYYQDEDVLDTWFSSALAPFAFLGWPQKKKLLDRYYPLDCMITAYDILFFWVARMSVDGVHFTKQMPFKKVVLHGLIRDSQGRKMSKSLNNGIDPFDVIKEYGADSLRYSLTTNGTPGLDLPFGNHLLEKSHVYLNKIWNAARFVLSSIPKDFKVRKLKTNDLIFVDHYLYFNLNKTIKELKNNMDKYELGQASQKLYNFVYDIFCSNYIELVKNSLREDGTRKEVVLNILIDVLKDILIMLFPYCPFICEDIYLKLPNHKNSIYEEKYPKKRPFAKQLFESLGSNLVSLIKFIRNYKMEHNLAIDERVNLDLHLSPEQIHQIEIIKPLLRKLIFANEINVVNTADGDYLNFGPISCKIHADADKLKEIIEKRRVFLLKEIERCEKMLGNPNFIAKAKQEKIAEEKDKLAKFQEEIKKYL